MNIIEKLLMRLLISIFIVIIILVLASCKIGGTKKITIENAQRDCIFYGVKGTGLKDKMPDYKITYTGKHLYDYCPVGSLACTNGYNIYLQNEDWLALGHELCHLAFKSSYDIKRRL